MIAIDCETTGLKPYQGSQPFFISIISENEKQFFWEWSVDTLTMKVDVDNKDIQDIKNIINNEKVLIFQNAKFDISFLQALGIDIFGKGHVIEDTLFAGHLLASNHFHDLTNMALEYLDYNIKPVEEKLKKSCTQAQRLIKQYYQASIPFGYWLAKSAANLLHYPANHSWHSVLQEYANMDSLITLRLWQVMDKHIQERGLAKIYRERLKLIEVTYGMEKVGITLNNKRVEKLRKRFVGEIEDESNICMSIAENYKYDLSLPKGGMNKSLYDFCFSKMGLDLKPVMKTPKGKVSLAKESLDHYLDTLNKTGDHYTFLAALQSMRKRETSVKYLDNYKEFWQEIPELKDWSRLHPSLNPTGTHTLRWSSSSPNEQNISKQKGFNLRYCFGPLPGREWWSLDAQNIELRIPAYMADEKELIEVFEYPKKPPYYGSYHLVIFDLLYPELFQKHGKNCKQLYASTYYQWIKNGNFAILYGAQRGKADATYHVKDAYYKICHRFPKITALARKQIEFANSVGFIETIPDKSVDPKRGYPLLCSYPNIPILPTIPLNYYVQGSAMWWMMESMIACYNKLCEWFLKNGFDGYLVMQVHDELVFDFPKSKRSIEDQQQRLIKNIFDYQEQDTLWRIKVIRGLLEKCGQNIGVPISTGIEYHEDNWAEGKTIEL